MIMEIKTGEENKLTRSNEESCVVGWTPET
jgi:hypothetical protein